MMRHSRHIVAQRRGANLIEFTLLFPFFLGIFFGVTDAAWLIYHKTALAAAVHDGCRQATLIDPGLNERDLETVLDSAIHEMETAFLDLGPACVDCKGKAEPIGARPGRALMCSMTTTYEPLTGLAFESQVVSAMAVMRLEYQRGTE